MTHRDITEYAVFGHPIEHSLSPVIHAAFAEQAKHDIHYFKQCVPLDAFSETVRTFFKHNGGGLNITVPFKLDAFDLADQLTERAQAAGAVNTLWQDAEGQLVGDNTDGAGLVRDITHNLGWSLAGKTLLMLGAGGAVRGALLPLAQQGPRKIIIVNRTPAKAENLVRDFSPSFPDIDWQSASYECLETTHEPVDMIINGTSSSLTGDLPPLPSSLIQPQTHCYDMMYGAKPTVFMAWASQLGCVHVSDGLGMLVEQAAEAFHVWRNFRPNTAQVMQERRSALSPASEP